MSEKEETEQSKPKENLLLKGWNDFISNITVGYHRFQKSFEENTKKNKELWNQNQEKIDQFFKSAKENWDAKLKEWGAELEKTHKENTNAWENDFEKMTEFFKKNQESWDKNLKEWEVDLEKRQIETKEQWEVRKLKISEDVKNWQEKTKKDWEKGLKSFRREMIKGSYMFLVFMIPILVVLFVIVALITRLFEF
ncbi:MAG: hypothetical protein HWN79_07500 [Candidatus Lokiarchaeota archaeon]|nr:hypothetical protein [Candidatus Lokiarchaeota archaeon]